MDIYDIIHSINVHGKRRDKMRQTDFTEGSVRGTVIRYFFPLLFSNILQQFYSFADMVIIGKGIDDKAVASVGNFITLSFMITGFIMGITNGFSVCISHEYGRRDSTGLRKTIAASVRLCIIFSVILTLVGIILLRPVILLMKTDSILTEGCLEYGYIIFGGIAVTVFYNLASAVLRASGDSRTPLLAVGTASAVNILTDILTIYVFGMGVRGAAAATVLAQLAATGICIKRLGRNKELKLCRSDFKYDPAVDGLLLKNGIPMALMNSVTSLGNIFVQSCVNSCGVVYTAAYAAGNKYLNIMMLPGITLGFTASAFTGQNYGAKRYSRIREGVRVSAVIAAAFVLLVSPFIFFMPSLFSELIVSGEDAVAYTSVYLVRLAVLVILLDLIFIFRSAVQGMGKPLVPMLSGIAEMLIRIVFILSCLPLLGFSATIYAEGAAWTGAMLMNMAAYLYYIRKVDSTL